MPSNAAEMTPGSSSWRERMCMASAIARPSLHTEELNGQFGVKYASFVSQGFDGIEPGGLDGGVEAEEEAHTHRNCDADKDGPERHGGRKFGNEKIDEQTQPQTDHDAD